MKQGIRKTTFAALVSCGLLAGCATTMDMAGPLGHYRYNYDSRIVYDTSPTVVYRDGVTYREPTVVYREPAAVYRYRPAVTSYYTYYDHTR